MASITVQPDLLLERVLSMEIVRVDGKGCCIGCASTGTWTEENAADQAAVVSQMRRGS